MKQGKRSQKLTSRQTKVFSKFSGMIKTITMSKEKIKLAQLKRAQAHSSD